MLKFGKKPAREGAISFKFGTFFDATVLPTPSMVFPVNRVLSQAWGMLANDQTSDCVFAGAAHETMLWCAWAGASVPNFTDANVLADYGQLTGFTPKDPKTDQGTDMQEAAAYRQKTGIVDAAGVRHKVDAYVALRASNLDDVALATYLFGAVGLGLQMPSSTSGQFDRAEPWAPVKGTHIDGGHYVPCVGRNSAGNFLIVTWGRLHAVTPDFLVENMDEGVAYLSFEQMRGTVNPRGFDEAGLRAALAKV